MRHSTPQRTQVHPEHSTAARLPPQMQPLNAPPYAAPDAPPPPIRADTPALLSRACAPAAVRARAAARRRHARRVPHHLVLRSAVLHRRAEPAVRRHDGRRRNAGPTLAGRAGTWCARVVYARALMNGRSAARPCELCFPPDERCVGVICLCVEPADVPALPAPQA